MLKIARSEDRAIIISVIKITEADRSERRTLCREPAGFRNGGKPHQQEQRAADTEAAGTGAADTGTADTGAAGTEAADTEAGAGTEAEQEQQECWG